MGEDGGLTNILMGLLATSVVLLGMRYCFIFFGFLPLLDSLTLPVKVRVQTVCWYC